MNGTDVVSGCRVAVAARRITGDAPADEATVQAGAGKTSSKEKHRADERLGCLSRTSL
jgi:hypothetical protein